MSPLFLHGPSSMGWMFVALALLFGLGLAPALARRFYPAGPGLPARLAAPVLFGWVAAGCFLGVGLSMRGMTAALGTRLILRRWGHAR